MHAPHLNFICRQVCVGMGSNLSGNDITAAAGVRL
jgi:hypothetical protein